MDPTLKLFLTFLIGVLSGAILVVLIYLLLMVLTIKKRSYIIEAQNADIEEKQILDIISQCKENYKFASKSDDPVIKDGAFKRNVTCMAEDIAKLFFPESKRPLAELTVDELLMLNRYITERINEIVDRPGLRFIKKLKLNTIIDLAQTKKKIEDSKPIEFAEKHHLGKAYKVMMTALNSINPVYWFKKLVIDNIIGVVIEKIKLNIIAISGQELYKVYSKKAFENDDVIDLEEDFDDVKEELSNLEKKKSKYNN